jgi:hypothetical protein
MSLIKDDLLKGMAEEFDLFKATIKDIPYERKGILYSEMFFLYLCLKRNLPKYIIESGRARGQSTFLLSKIFPNTEIFSIEHDEKSPDVAVATERLKDCKNVKLLFGDATTLMPNLASRYPNSAILIDGPKGFRAVRLAINLLKKQKISKIFIHDTSFDTDERAFLEKYLPSTIYSDDPCISESTRFLDEGKDLGIPVDYQYIRGKPYGYSLACISPEVNKSLSGLILKSRIDQFLNRF